MTTPNRYKEPPPPDWSAYEAMKRTWIDEHPECTPEEFSAAMRLIADTLGL